MTSNKRALAGPPQGFLRLGPEWVLNPAFHQYVCVKSGKVTACGGQTTDSAFGYGKGKPTTSATDYFSPGRCREVLPDDICIEACLREKFAAPRPVYGLAGPGTNCQEWTDEAIGSCRLKCWLKRVGR